jgi:hypothetical protein
MEPKQDEKLAKELFAGIAHELGGHELFRSIIKNIDDAVQTSPELMREYTADNAYEGGQE